MRIRNLANSPYPVVLADGSKVTLPAKGELTGVTVHPSHLPLYRFVGYFEFDEDDNSPLTVNLGEKLDTNSIRLVTPGTKDDKPQAQTTRSNPRTKKES